MALPDLKENDRRSFKKLYASAADLRVARQWAQHVQKKGWFRPPWTRGKIYLHQSAYVTAIVVAYGRIFAPGRGRSHFPRRLIPYGAAEWDLHERLLEMRHKVHAHTDLEKWKVEPWQAGDFRTTIVGQPMNLIVEADLDLFLAMTEKLLKRIETRQEEILAPYRAARAEETGRDPKAQLMAALERLEVSEMLIIRPDAG